MIEVFTPSEMKRIDETAINKLGVPSSQLMENAGRAFVEEINKISSVKNKKIAVFCGKGNNGGDGFVIARLLVERSASVTVVCLDGPADFTKEAAENFRRLKDFSIPIFTLHQFFSGIHGHFDCIIDAIFGTSFRGSVQGKYLKIIRWINSQNRSINFAVDIPSGLNGETGIVETDAVHAHFTITFSNPKIGFYRYNAKDFTGKVIVVDIGIPEKAFKKSRSNIFLIEKKDCSNLLPKRPSNSHKHSVGKIFVIAGSKGMIGAALLCSSSAMRSGAGQVILGIPDSEYQIAAKRTLEVMPLGLSSTTEGTLALKSLKEIERRALWADTVAIGCGLSQHEETRSLIIDFVQTCIKPLVIDADALNALSKNISILQIRKSQHVVLTPHHGEFSRLIGIPSSDIEENKFSLAKEFAEKYHLTLVLKGAPTIVASQTGNIFINPTGNPGMSTAGSGDVLCGIIAAFSGQHLTPDSAAIAGCYLHGLAGDAAAEKKGVLGMIASDIIKYIPSSISTVAS